MSAFCSVLIAGAALTACGSGEGTILLVAAKITVSDTVNPQDDSVVSFGTIAAGYSGMEAVVVTNSGSAGLSLGQVAASDGLAAPFSIALDTCSGTRLAPGSHCDILLRFAPLSAGTFMDSFDIPSSDPDHPEIAVGVLGSGTFAVPVPHMVVTDSVAPVDDRIVPFGTLNLSTASTRTITIANDGTVNLVVGQIGQAYPLTGPFSMTSACSGQSIAPSQTCTFTVGFHPDSPGTFSSAFDIPSNDPGGTVGIAVSGTGVDLLSPARLSFGTVAANQTSDLTLTVTNNEGADIVLGQVGGLDGLAAPFSIASDNCSGATIAPAASCQVIVRFAPTLDGSFAEAFDVPASGAVAGDFDVAVSGSSGTGSVSGTITLPSPSNGACYLVVLSPSFTPTDPLLNAVAVATGQTNGTASIAYSLSDIAPGTYYLYAGVDIDGNSATPPECLFQNPTPTHGDFSGFYGGGFPTAPNALVNFGTNSLDFSLATF
jgi:hypothetical protein